MGSYRTPVYASTFYPLFDVKLRDDLYHLNPISGQFEKVDQTKQFLCPTEGIITLKKVDDTSVATYEAVSLKELSIIFVAMRDNHCQLMFRAGISSNHGLQFFMLDSALTLENGRFATPIEFKLNTVMIFGIKSKTSRMDFRVFANSTGAIDIANFNGYATTCFMNCTPNFQVNFIPKFFIF